MLTLLLIFWPLASVILVMLFGGRNAKWLAFVSSLLSFGVTLYILSFFDPATAGLQEQACGPDGNCLGFSASWISKFHINFAVDMDGISMMMVLLTNLLCPLIFLSSFRYHYERPVLFYSMALLMQSALIGVFTATDIFLYYIFWELALIPIYIIVLRYGGINKEKITFKFFIYTMVGSLLMLLGIIFLKTGHVLGMESELAQNLVFGAFMLAFAIKIPIFPLHTWQPDTYTTAPPQGTMLLSGIMLKMGLYSIIRWIIPNMHEALSRFDKPLIILAIAGIVYASWIAITRRDMKRLFAYSSIAHVGLIAAGIFTLTPQGLQGGLIQMLSHGINVIGLFFVAQIIYDRTRTHDLPSLGGIINQAPVFATLFLIILFGSVALPLTNGFVGEFMLLHGLYEYSPWAAAVAGLTVIFGAVYMLMAYQRSMLGEVRAELPVFRDLYTSEAIVLMTVAGLVLFIGVYPTPFLNLTEPAVNQLLENISSHSIMEY